ncbi:MAG: GTP cyclohydrolase FolE2 [Succiniclasticum sp.]|jgi:GTP cyclohydrolase I|nr:GTP cyclohydrolase FolE2 [Succiniclasticum sp.]MEE3479723.1 GTP cyclohydrolase FolE2 [Succiniclasticum sp.]
MLKDVQSEQDTRNIPLKRVGIKDLRWPLTLRDRQNGKQHTVARVSLAVNLPRDLRGTHMSRFVQCLKKLDVVNLSALEEVLDDLKQSLEADSAYMRLTFPYFIEKKAPVSGLTSLMDLNCTFTMEKGDTFRQRVKVEVPVQTLCPCSKEISDYGAHNQRATASLEIEMSEFIWIEELAEMADAGASSPVYGLLKRPDEKFVTEHAYENPRFVEDAVREIALRLEKDRRVTWYRVTVESMESIHNHNAFATVEKGWMNE